MTEPRSANCIWQSPTRRRRWNSLQPEDVDMTDPEQVAIWKTVQILLNKVIYADGYLQE